MAERTSGKAYTSDNDYAALHGRVVKEFTVTRHTKRNGRKCQVMTTYEVIDIGRPDPVRPSNPTVLLEPEYFEPVRNNARILQERKRKRHDAIQEQIVDHLLLHGMAHIKDLVKLTGYSRQLLRSHLIERSEIYQPVPDMRGLWTLAEGMVE